MTALCGLLVQLLVTDAFDAVALVAASLLAVTTLVWFVRAQESERGRRLSMQALDRLQAERDALAAAVREQALRLVLAETARSRAEQRAHVAEQQLAEVIVLSRGAYLVAGSERRH